MNVKEQQSMFKEMGVETFYIGKSLDDPQRATIIFQGPENVPYDIFTNPETKPIVEVSGHNLCWYKNNSMNFLKK